MQGENTSQCRPLASVFNASDAVLWRKSRRNTNCKQPLVFAVLSGALYLLHYRDVNGLLWLAQNGAYRQETDSSFRFQKENLISVETDKNITYRLKFEFRLPRANQAEIEAFDQAMEKIKGVKVGIYADKRLYGTFRLYQHTDASWSAGTAVYRDRSRHPVVSGFVSEPFALPFSFGTQQIGFKFDMDNEQAAGYMNQSAITVFIVQDTVK